jgi:gamma-glutamylcyclotransferase (GGCT)/AIG2-like uncharacterized protein YtfP
VTADHCLATYGSLAPGRPNHHQLAQLSGRWFSGRVKGRLVPKGWGAALGFPALVLAADGEDIEVQVFISSDLPQHWDRLDAFEGADYQRVCTQVWTASGRFDVWIYVDRCSSN